MKRVLTSLVMGGKWLATSLVPLLAISVGLNVLLAQQVRRLERVISVVKAEGQLQPGTEIKDMELNSTDGRRTSVSYKSPLPTILYVMKPTCGWCKRNNPNLNALVQQSTGKFNVVVLSLDSEGASEYRDAAALRVPIFFGLDEASVLRYKFGGTPQTVLVSPQGQVLKTWMGAYQDSLLKDVERELKVELPGLSAVPTAPTVS